MGWLNRPECRYRLDILIPEALDEHSTYCPYPPAWALYRRDQWGKMQLAQNGDHEYVWACEYHKQILESSLEDGEVFYRIRLKWASGSEGEGAQR
jgi:hypothetical protein